MFNSPCRSLWHRRGQKGQTARCCAGRTCRGKPWGMSGCFSNTGTARQGKREDKTWMHAQTGADTNPATAYWIHTKCCNSMIKQEEYLPRKTCLTGLFNIHYQCNNNFVNISFPGWWLAASPFHPLLVYVWLFSSRRWASWLLLLRLMGCLSDPDKVSHRGACLLREQTSPPVSCLGVKVACWT